MKKYLSLFLVLLLLAALAGCAGEAAEPVAPASEPALSTPEPTPAPSPTPEPTPVPEPPATELTASLSLTDSIGGYTPLLLDGDHSTYLSYRRGDSLTVSGPEPIHALYLKWYTPPEKYVVTVGRRNITAGIHGYLHEFLLLPDDGTEITLDMKGLSQLCELRAFTDGALPADVQVWEEPCHQADVLIFSAHGDDDVIFFGAAAVDFAARGLDVQICYLVHHYDWQPRPQELLDALWAMGIRHYPVIGPFPDHYVLSLEDARGRFGEEDVIAYEVEQLRRFRPSVVLGHDLEGEYGHGAHMLCAEALTQAVELAADPEVCPESAEAYGPWDTPKLYLHMYGDAPIVLDVETPLEAFAGRTAFQVAGDAMLCHESQLVYSHRPQLDDPEFPRYDCRVFGLYRSTVGPDTGNDPMEHIPFG